MNPTMTIEFEGLAGWIHFDLCLDAYMCLSKLPCGVLRFGSALH
jgi:hypothetical protein